MKIKIKEILHIIQSRHYIARISQLGNFIWAAVKLFLGVYNFSFFLIIGGIYTLAVGISKLIYVKGRKESNDETAKEKGYYLQMCGVLGAASLFYVAYMIRYFIVPPTENYSDLFAISFAALAFTELTVAIVGLVKSNKQNDLLKSGLKSINLASALTALAFTQVAILSFAAEDINSSFYNGISGVIMGSGCLIICLFMLIKYLMISKKLKEIEINNFTATNNITAK